MSGVPRSPLRDQTVALIGAGGLARALSGSLIRCGARVRIAARRPARARALVRALRSPRARALANPVEAVEGCTLLVLCVPDDALGELARALAREVPGRGRVVLHASGFQGEAPLAPLARAGWHTGSLHPLLALPRTAQAARALDGAWFATSGLPRARRAARRLVRALGGRELALRTGAKPDYHLAASLVSNGTLALFELARKHFEPAALRPREARAAFAALLSSTAANLARSSPRDALTGPIARGDLASVRGHLARLRSREEKQAYRALGRVLLALSTERRALSRERARTLESWLQ